ncbi:SGNH/GDSL hydrolase family protein [Massilia sp. DWR3-1-1]|uniref:SGNH/GDSL hydrolase family protein n=1 Tax=Massilia sp. DWR3-1-1 TaxID=2804559 RepID=UPI003CFAECEA
MSYPARSVTSSAIHGAADTLALWVFAVLAVLQAIIVADLSDGALRTVGLAGLALTLLLTVVPTGRRGKLPAVALVALALAINFTWFLIAVPDPSRWRIMLVAVATGYVSTLLAILPASLLPRLRLGIWISALTLTLTVPLSEWIFAQTEPGRQLLSYNPTVIHWSGGTAPHPVLEEYYPPNTVATTYYRSNPNAYFTRDDTRSQQWQLNIADPASAAALQFPAGAADRATVTMARAAQQIWQVQLVYPGLTVADDDEVMVAFRVRAAQPRTIGVGVGQNHAPWESLGLYKQITVNSVWQDVLLPFHTKGGDDHARLHFDLGSDAAAVDIEQVQVRRRVSSMSMVRPIAASYSVEYRFNDQGCRGASLPSTPASGHRRILVLGDSYGLGVGVHQQDTMSVQLERLLNSGSGTARSDVVNCSVSGYATLQERQMYAIQAPFYRPAVVIVPMVQNDADSWRDDVRDGYFYERTKFDRLFLMWGVYQGLRHAKPPADFSKNVQELRALRDACAKNGARLVVVSFRNGNLEQGEWGRMAATIKAGVAGTDIIWADLGDAIKGQQDWRSLYVHPEGDFHPNAVAHAHAAAELARLLRANGLAN